MKKSGILLSLVLIIILLAGCGSGVRTYSDPDQGIEIGVGDEFIIALGSNPSAGYIWEMDYDQDMLQFMLGGYRRIEPNKRGDSGASSEETFRFKALNKGKTDITMIYRKLTFVGEPCTSCDDGSVPPWEGEGIRWIFKVQTKS